MTGIKEMVSEFYMDALEVIANNLPSWIISWSIHPDDRMLYSGSPLEQFRLGSRILENGKHGSNELLFDKLLDRLIETAPQEVYYKMMCGAFTVSDCDKVCQYARFGKIKYPPEEKAVHRGAVAA